MGFPQQHQENHLIPPTSHYTHLFKITTPKLLLWGLFQKVQRDGWKLGTILPIPNNKYTDTGAVFPRLQWEPMQPN